MSKFVIDLDDSQESWDALYKQIENELSEPSEEEAVEEWIPYHGFWLLTGLSDS